MRELRLRREVRRCRLVIPRGIAEDIEDRLGTRAVILPQGQNAISGGSSYAGAVILLCSVGNLRQRLLKSGIERCLELRIQGYKDFMRGRRRRRFLRCEMRCTQANQVGLMGSLDGVDGVISRRA